MTDVIYVTEEELTETIRGVLEQYPWMENHPVSCHVSCASWEIEEEHGPEVRRAWDRLDNALWLLKGQRAGVPVDRT